MESNRWRLTTRIWKPNHARHGRASQISVVACDHPAADMAAGRCSYAGTIDIVHTRAACVADLRDHAVWLMKRRRRHGLRGCCDGQSKCNSDEPNHCHLPYEPSKKDFLEEERAPSRRLPFQYTPYCALLRVSDAAFLSQHKVSG